MSHTPGEWKAIIEMEHRNHRGGFSIEVDNFRIDRGHGHAVICGRAGWPSNAEESAANARLIAAAPDLLAVLRRVSMLLADECDFGVLDKHPNYQLWRDVESAIQK